LVEDNEAAIIQMNKVLESDGYQVDVARDGQEAIDYVEKVIPAGIILDLMMPGVDGFEVLEKLRSKRSTENIPVLVLTARDLTKKDLERLSANNIQQLIQKGDVDREKLLLKIRLMLGGEPKVGLETGNLKFVGAKRKSRQDRRGSGKTQKPGIEHRETGTEKPAVSRKTAGTPTILVVEDNPDNLITIKAVLQNEYNILEATDGEEGLKMAMKERPDLILLDMSLPKMDGFAVAGKIKEEKNTRHIPVIALTAHAMKGSREKAIEAGCDDYISKPVEPEGVLQKIKDWLEK